MDLRYFILLLLGVQYVVAPPPPNGRQMAGPCVGMDCMHGILMHGDAEGGDDHKHEDDMKKNQEAYEESKKKREPDGPCQGMDCMHGALMHNGDEAAGETAHMHQKVGPEQPKQKAGPGEGMEVLHGVMMHGDNRPGRNHDDEHRKLTEPAGGAEERKTQEGPCVGMDCLHGVLMHGDGEAGGDHREEHDHDKDKLLEKSGRKFSAPDPESAMHGGAEGDDHDHVHDGKQQAIPEKHKGVPSVSDPHEAIHGHLKDQIKADSKKTKEDDDYYEWLRLEKKKNKGGAHEDKKYQGHSFPSITDTILDNIEVLKRRYLPKFWGGGATEGGEVAPPSVKEEKQVAAEVHELLSDLEMIGDTGPRKEHHHHGSKQAKEKDGSGSGSGSRSGSGSGHGIKHEEV